MRQKRSKPPPVPEMPTVTRAPLFFFWKPSAAADVYGPSVLEPSAVTVPLSALTPAAADAASTAVPSTASAINFLIFLPCVVSMLSGGVSERRGAAWAERR